MIIATTIVVKVQHEGQQQPNVASFCQQQQEHHDHYSLHKTKLFCNIPHDSIVEDCIYYMHIDMVIIITIIIKQLINKNSKQVNNQNQENNNKIGGNKKMTDKICVYDSENCTYELQ